MGQTTHGIPYPEPISSPPDIPKYMKELADKADELIDDKSNKTLDNVTNDDFKAKAQEAGVEGTNDYEDLINKPKLNNIELTGEITITATDVKALPDTTVIPANTSDLTNDSGYIDKTVDDLENYYNKTETDEAIELAIQSAIQDSWEADY